MTLPPLPECYSRFKHEDGMPLYSAEQMQAYAAAAVAAEREACAQVCEGPVAADDWDGSYWLEATKACAAAIRARSAV